MKRSLRKFLGRRGASSAEIDNAARHGYLSLLVLDRAVMPGRREFTMIELAARAKTDVETARSAWRAIGFPDLPDDLPAFTASDVDALRSVVRRIESGSMFEWTLDRALSQARVLNAALSRVADSLTDDLSKSMQLAREAGLGDEDLAHVLAERFDFEDIARLIDHSHRLQLRAAVWRRLAGVDAAAPGTLVGAVGFVDIVGYTALVQDLEPEELSALLRTFGDLAHDIVVDGGGRIVKTIGDEVMYVTDSAKAAAGIALDLTERSSDDDRVPALTAGVAFGSLLAREGDYFGPVVNLASRLTDIARPGQVLASAELSAALTPESGIGARRAFSKRIRDIGRVDVCSLERKRSEA